MSNLFITSDEHYGHINIISYCKRPFTGIEEMREELIRRHNAKVPNNPNVLTIHLGDMFWHTVTATEALGILQRLNGRHAFIYGNHDELIEQHRLTFLGAFDWIVGRNKESGTRIVRWNGHEITLCHYAMTVWNRSHKGSWMLYGHSHGELAGQPGKSFDVGVDCHNFEPWSMEEIESEMATRPQGHVISQPWPGKESDAGEESGDSGSSRSLVVPGV